MASSALSSRPCSSKTARGHSSPVSGIDDHGPGQGPPERAPRGVRRALHRSATFGGAVGVVDGAAEPLGEPGHVGLGGLVAEHPPQRVVGIVGLLGGVQDVGERLAHVVEVGGAELPDVGEELGGAEPLARASVAPAARAGAQPVIRALEWNSGMAT